MMFILYQFLNFCKHDHKAFNVYGIPEINPSRGRLKFQYSTLVFSYNLLSNFIIHKNALMNTASSKHQSKVRNL